MSRAVNSSSRHNKRRKILQQAKVFWGRRSKLYRTAKDAVAKSLVYAYRDRRRRKRDMRRLWIQRISAAAHQRGMNYSLFIHGLIEAGVTLNRKVLAHLAVEDSAAFDALVERAKEVHAAGSAS